MSLYLPSGEYLLSEKRRTIGIKLGNLNLTNSKDHMYYLDKLDYMKSGEVRSM